MIIRHYQPGDESAQAHIYNTGAAGFSGFKPANEVEILRRYRDAEPDPASKLYAVDSDGVKGYTVFNANGRISYPWCLPGFEDERSPLLDALLTAMRARGHARAWATYRADWELVLSFLRSRQFQETRRMINYVAATTDLPHSAVPRGWVIRPLERRDLAPLVELGRGLFAGSDPATLEPFFWQNPFFDASSLFALVPEGDEQTLLGAGVVITNPGYADPTKIDASMPCFRLGALGTELQRHKRVNGLFSCVFASERAGETVLAEAVRRLEASGIAQAAAQVPSDQPHFVSFHDSHFRRQGVFPILERPLTSNVPSR